MIPKLTFSTILLYFLFTALHAQFLPDPAAGDTANYPYWVQMMQDPGARFRDTRRAFEKYWAGDDNIRHNGWKVFKRWEYINQDCMKPDGTLPSPGEVLHEYQQYFNSHDATMSDNGNWSQIGPVNYPVNSTGQPTGLGRINGICFHPTNPDIIYVGSPSGGLWLSTDGAATWNVLTSSTPTLGVSAILLHPTNSSLIFIGTGDRDAGDSPGMGVYKSLDGGTTWSASNTGMGNLTVGSMIMHPADPNMILAATSGGIYKSVNGGTSWTRKSSNTSNYKDIRFKPGDPTIVYATEGGKFYRSINSGDTWTQITSGVITGNRLVIGVSANQPATVYLCMTNGAFAGLLRSTDSGLTFLTQSTTPNIMDYNCDGGGTGSQAWYDLCIAVDPTNANTLYVGGVNIWKSTNSGVSWTINSHWVGSSWGYSCAPSLHADIHCLEWSAANGSLATGCDGGIYSTINGGTTWANISSGLGIAQVYRIGQSAGNQAICMSGYQDNGTAKNTGPNFTTVIGGDGMECIVDYSDTNYRYGALYYGDIRRSTGGGFNTIAANGSNGINEGGSWVTPYILHETIPSTMFIGYVNVWRSINVKASPSSSVTWTKISTGETGGCAVLEQSPANVDVLYVVRSGSLKRSDNANATTPTWTVCTLPGGSTPSDLEAHPTDPNIVYASAGTKIYKSADKGATWINISGTLPAVNINCLVYDKTSNEGLYVGNKTNVFYKDATLTDWIAFSTGLPPVDVRELEIFYDPVNPANNRLKAATYGRGLWQSDLYNVFAVTPANQNVSYVAGSTSFNVTTNAATSWAVVSTASWCTVTPSGSGNGSIIASYTDNPGITTRLATLTATPTGGLPVQVVTVTQAGAPPMLVVTPQNQNVPSPAGTTSFTVTCNTLWTAATNAAWCVVTTSGSGNGAIVADFTENPGVSDRVAVISIMVANLPSQTVTVTQAGAAPVLSVLPPNQNVPASTGVTSFTVTSNTDWTVVSNALWCNVTMAGFGNGMITANVEENLSVSQRIATVTVSVTGLAPVIVTVSQDGATPTLAVSPQNRNVSPLAGSTDFTVTSNTGWSAFADVAWCIVTSGGSGNGTIIANYAENPDYASRVATISVTVSGLSSQLVTVTQTSSVVSVGEHLLSGIRVYPNPTAGKFRIMTPDNTFGMLRIRVMDCTGGIVCEKNCSVTNDCDFDFSNLSQGFYFVRINTESESLIRKLVIVR
ncbi:MAG: BACON domain-containing carbohydrate-binding protein [Bacteroidota bacterium]